MPYKDPETRRAASTERSRRRRERNRPPGWVDGRGRHGNHRSGPEHYAWNDGALTSVDGYRLVRVGEGHPMADPNGYALEHRLVIATALGRPLLTSEVVHHINGNRLDNRVENLQVVTNGEHSRIHNAMKARDERGCFTREFPEATHD